MENLLASRTVLVALLGSCAGSCLPCFGLSLTLPFTRRLRPHNESEAQTDSELLRITDPQCARGQLTPGLSVATELAFPCLIPRSSANVSYLFPFNSVCPICLGRVFCRAKPSSHCALSALLQVALRFCNQSVNIHDPSC